MYLYPLIALLLLIVGCAQTPSSDAARFHDDGKIKILSTTAMIDDLAREIGGEYVDSIPLIRGELDPHSYELVKGDDEKFAASDLVFYNGLGLEHGLSLRQNLEHNPKAVDLSASILKANPEAILIVEGQYDPHIWMDVTLWMQVVEPISSALSSKDPDHADYYRARAETLLNQMRLVDEAALLRLQAIGSEKRYLVTSHDAFNYFTRRYLAAPGEVEWKNRCAAPEGLAPESQMSVTDVMAILSHVEEFNISVLFPESNMNKDALKKILSAAKEKGLSIRLCPHALYADSMGETGSYLEMMNHNMRIIAEELEQ